MLIETLLEKNLDSLWFTALRLTGNKDDAEDLLQDTCIKAFENIKSLQFPSKARGWLFTILTNTFLNNQRKKKIIQQDIEPDLLEPIFYKNGHYFNLEKDIFSKVLDEEVTKAIDNLPLDFRVVILFIDIEELSYREVQDILKIAPGTLASRLYRGRRLLRDSLYEYANKMGFLKTPMGKENDM